MSAKNLRLTSSSLHHPPIILFSSNQNVILELFYYLHKNERKHVDPWKHAGVIWFLILNYNRHNVICTSLIYESWGTTEVPVPFMIPQKDSQINICSRQKDLKKLHEFADVEYCSNSVVVQCSVSARK